ncbi:MAG: carbohydrate kinase [Anaerolineae bacterium]|nr:carbohydrate kinase [Anaerolineae bacterium]
MNALDALIAIDLGTTHVKAAVFDLHGKRLARAARSCLLQRLQPTWCEQDLVALQETAFDCLAECVRTADLPQHAYRALAVTAQGDGTRLLRADGSPVRSAIIWQDARAVPLVRRWQADGRARLVAHYTGTALSASHQTAQLAWLLEHEPCTLDETWRVFFAKDWLFFQLTGEAITDQSDASHTYLDWRSRQFEPRVLEILGLSELAEKLPPVRLPSECIAPLRSDRAKALGLPADLPVVLAPFDVVAELISVSGGALNTACSVFGTAGIHQVSLAELSSQDSQIGGTTYIPSQHGYIRFVPTMLATPNIEYWAQLLYPGLTQPYGMIGTAELESQLARIPVGAEGILYLPFLAPSGERAPHLLPEARAQFSGVSLLHTRAHLLRAVYEGVALAAAHCYAFLPDFTPPLRLTGGGARSPLLAQMMADILNVEVVTYDSLSGALRGAAMYAATLLGIFPDLAAAFSAMQSPCQAYTPSVAVHAAYCQLAERYRRQAAMLT